MQNSFLILALILFPAGCQLSVEERPQEEILTLEVARDSVPCVGEMTGMCLQVRTPEETEWRKFYDPIEGFRHEKGTAYILKVGRSDVKNPPADGSAFRYRLIRIIHEDPGDAREDGAVGSRFP